MNRADRGPCLMADFGISCVETSAFVYREVT
jgi:hypothetical protein